MSATLLWPSLSPCLSLSVSLPPHRRPTGQRIPLSQLDCFLNSFPFFFNTNIFISFTLFVAQAQHPFNAPGADEKLWSVDLQNNICSIICGSQYRARCDSWGGAGGVRKWFPRATSFHKSSQCEISRAARRATANRRGLHRRLPPSLTPPPPTDPANAFAFEGAVVPNKAIVSPALYTPCSRSAVAPPVGLFDFWDFSSPFSGTHTVFKPCQ